MIETKTAQIYLKNDILYLTYNEKSVIGIEEIKENLDARLKLQEAKKVLTFVDVREVWEYSPEARAIIGGDDFKAITIAMAVVVGYALPIKIIANFFMKINKPNYPTKLFKNEENAIKWLNSFK
jgi:hypothetical protein